MRIDWDHMIWICFSCGELFNSEICWSFTGECYDCYPRIDQMKIKKVKKECPEQSYIAENFETEKKAREEMIIKADELERLLKLFKIKK